MSDFIADMAKVELHVHLEGCVEPRLLLDLAAKNDVELGFANEDEVWAAQDYPDPALPNFLDYHYKCVRVLQTPDDFHAVTEDFLHTCADQNVRHVEIMFGPMAHTARGVEFGPMFEAMDAARTEVTDERDLSCEWIICIDREHTQDEAFAMLDEAEPYKDRIVGLGLASYEKDNPPVKFLDAYRRAASEGYRLTAHCDCDQDNSVMHIWQCIDELGVERVDHGLHVLDDPRLIEEVRDRKIALTMCPTWRPRDPEPRRLRPVGEMLELGLLVSLNTDDPSEFASRHMTHMLTEVQRRGGYSNEQMTHFMANAIDTAWVSDTRRAELHSALAGS